MKMEFIYMKQALKLPAYEEICGRLGVPDSAVACIGDDLPDWRYVRGGLRRRRRRCCSRSKKSCRYITKALAGHGAVREAVELVLKAKGAWAETIVKARA